MGSSLHLEASHHETLRVVVCGTPDSGAPAFGEAVHDHGHECHRCEGATSLVQYLLAGECDVVVAFLSDPVLVRAVASWFAGRRPSMPLVVQCGSKDDTEALHEALAINPSALLWVDLPPQTQVQQLYSVPLRKGIVGRFLEIELVDYVQVQSLNAANKRVRVQTRNGSGYLWFQQGRIVHAEYGDIDSEAAFYALVSGDSGSFCEVAYAPAPRISIQSSNTHLLMEASRLKDESSVSTAQMGGHPMDAELYHDMCRLERGDLPGDPSESEFTAILDDAELLSLDDLDCANELEFFGDEALSFEIHNARDFVSYCNAQPGVIQATALAFDAGPEQGDDADALRQWGHRALSVLALRDSEPNAAVSFREGQTHFVGVVVGTSLVIMQVLGTHDPFALRDALLEGLGR